MIIKEFTKISEYFRERERERETSIGVKMKQKQASKSEQRMCSIYRKRY